MHKTTYLCCKKIFMCWAPALKGNLQKMRDMRKDWSERLEKANLEVHDILQQYVESTPLPIFKTWALRLGVWVIYILPVNFSSPRAFYTMIQVAESARRPCAEGIAGLCNPSFLFPASFTCTYAGTWVMSGTQHAQGSPLTGQCCKLLSSSTAKRKHRKNQKGEEHFAVQGLGGHGANRTVSVLWLPN